MNVEKENKKIILLEITKWIGVVILLLAFSVGNYLYCNQYNFFIRAVVFFIIIILAMYIASNTVVGRLAVKIGNDSRFELQKIVWPTYQDGWHTTLVVVAVTVVVSLILWGLDTVLVHVISFALRL